MDARLTLALITKTQRIFEQQGTYISFPLGPYAFRPAELDLSVNDCSAEEYQRILQNLSEFSRLVNLVPDSVRWPPVDPRFLWDVISDVYGIAELACKTASSGESEAYEKAYRVLYTTLRGIPMASKESLLYNRYHDMWIAADQAYNVARDEAANSPDSQVKTQWRDVIEPRLATKRDEAMLEWIAQGYKREVEDARRLLTALAAKDPANVWEEWWKPFQSKIYEQTDLDSLTFHTTFFHPVGVQHLTEWATITLSRKEAELLAAQAPKMFRDMLSGESSSDFASVTFEYTSVGITRPWFPSDALKATFWRFPDHTRILSDGAIPPSGPLPAYVAALVLVRRVEMAGWIVGKPVPSIGPLLVERLTPWDKIGPRAPNVSVRPDLDVTLLRRTGLPRGKSLAGPIVPTSTSVTSPLWMEHMARHHLSIPTTSTPTAEKDDCIYILAFICKYLGRCPNPADHFVF